MYNVLVIGCGNIGAQYDLNSDEVLTHVKGYVNHGAFTVDIFDLNQDLQASIAERYQVQAVPRVDVKTLAGYDVVSICTPTHTHSAYLMQAFEAKVPVILLEKPVAYALEDLAQLEKRAAQSASSVLVNYIRRFQPKYKQAKRLITLLEQESRLAAVQISYQRGFLNNASHLFDTIAYLRGREVTLTDVTIGNAEADIFPEDPTLSLTAKMDTAEVYVNAIKGAPYTVFEAVLYYEAMAVLLLDRGDRIAVRVPEGAALSEAVAEEVAQWPIEGAIRDYMVPVIEAVYAQLQTPERPDNFATSLRLNQHLLNLRH